MKKLLFSFLMMIMSLLPISMLASPVYAVDVINNVCSNPNAASSTLCANNPKTPSTRDPVYVVLQDIIFVLSIVVGIASVIVIMVQGLRLILSNGDPKAVETARNAIVYAVAGVFIAVLGQVIVAFVLTKFTS